MVTPLIATVPFTPLNPKPSPPLLLPAGEMVTPLIAVMVPFTPLNPKPSPTLLLPAGEMVAPLIAVKVTFSHSPTLPP